MYEYETFRTKSKNLFTVNSVYAVAYLRGGLFSPSALPWRGSPCCCVGLRRGMGALHCGVGARVCPDFLVFPFSGFSSKSSKTQNKSWESIPITSLYLPKPTMSKTDGWIVTPPPLLVAVCRPPHRNPQPLLPTTRESCEAKSCCLLKTHIKFFLW